MRIVVDHAYHGIDYERVWRTLRDDVPSCIGIPGSGVPPKFPRNMPRTPGLVTPCAPGPL